MRIINRPGWHLPDSAATAEHVAFGRRRALLAAGGILAATGVRAQPAGAPAMRNPRYRPERALSEEADATTYNNYYEFSGGKNLWRAAARLPQRPWTVRIEGMVEQPRTIDIDDLLKQVSLEERVYRHRCVEAWAMTVPWTGFPAAELLRIAAPLSSAKYVMLETAALPQVMPGLRQSWYPWPYQEGMTVAEAGNELAFIATGLYGKALPPQNGGPIRLVLPWKYGFKGTKSITRIVFTDTRPVSFWEKIQPSEYGFWANVNPEVPHPRWSQASERLLGTNERVPTKIYNGYGEFVAPLYTGIPASERLFT